MTIGFDRGVGCYPERLSEAERSAPVYADQFQHEIATAFNLKDVACRPNHAAIAAWSMRSGSSSASVWKKFMR